MVMAPEAPLRGDDTHMRLMCSHGGRFVQPRVPGGESRYVGGETRVLVVPRAVSFRDLAALLAVEMAGASGSEVRSIMHRLADQGLEDVVVSVTCDQEVAHMRDEYDRLRATRPAARFRVFVTTTPTTTTTATSSAGSKTATTAAGLPPLAPSMRRAKSEQAFAARAHQHRPMMRRVQSAQELAGGAHVQPSFHHHRRQHCYCCFFSSCSCQRRVQYTPAPPPARPAYALPYMPKKVAAPAVSTAKAAGRVAAVSTEAAAATEKARSRDIGAAPAVLENRRAIWEFE